MKISPDRLVSIVLFLLFALGVVGLLLAVGDSLWWWPSPT